MSGDDTYKTRFKDLVVATLSVLIDGGAPESAIYLAAGADYQMSIDVVSFLKSHRLISSKHHWMEITDHGRKVFTPYLNKKETK